MDIKQCLLALLSRFTLHISLCIFFIFCNWCVTVIYEIKNILSAKQHTHESNTDSNSFRRILEALYSSYHFWRSSSICANHSVLTYTRVSQSLKIKVVILFNFDLHFSVNLRNQNQARTLQSLVFSIKSNENSWYQILELTTKCFH